MWSLLAIFAASLVRKPGSVERGLTAEKKIDWNKRVALYPAQVLSDDTADRVPGE